MYNSVIIGRKKKLFTPFFQRNINVLCAQNLVRLFCVTYYLFPFPQISVVLELQPSPYSDVITMAMTTLFTWFLLGTDNTHYIYYHPLKYKFLNSSDKITFI